MNIISQSLFSPNMSFILLNQLYRLHGNGRTIPVLVHIKKKNVRSLHAKFNEEQHQRKLGPIIIHQVNH